MRSIRVFYKFILLYEQVTIERWLAVLVPCLFLGPCIFHLPLPCCMSQDSNVWISLTYAASPVAQPREAPEVVGQDERFETWIPCPWLPRYHSCGPWLSPSKAPDLLGLLDHHSSLVLFSPSFSVSLNPTVVVESPNHVQLFNKPINCSRPGLPVPHYFTDFAQVHVYWIDDAIQPSHPLSPSSPSAFNLSQH